jgi:hypothetical protein
MLPRLISRGLIEATGGSTTATSERILALTNAAVALTINRTKMFHVKHFGTIGAKNLTRPHTPGGLVTSTIAGKIGILGVG